MKNKLLTALLSLGVAMVLWLYVVTVVSPNSDGHYNHVPITVQGEAVLQDRGLMIVSGDLPTVSLHLEGNRTDLNKINKSNISVGVDVSGIGEPGQYNLSLTQPTFLTDVPNTAIAVLSKDPGTVTIEVDYRVSKPVPVEIQYSGSLPENYMADKENRILDYETVNISGPQTVVDQIAMARIEVDLNDRSESLSGRYAYTLCNEKGEPVDAKMIVTDVEAVNLTLKIVRVKEVALWVEIQEGGGATEATSVITLDPKVILVSGSDALLEDLDSLKLGVLDLGELSKDEVRTFPIKLPEGITNETGVNEVKVDVKFPTLSTKVVTVTDIRPVNVPDDLDVQIITRQLELLLRGPGDVLESVAAEDITVTVDFANEQPGTTSLKVLITVKVAGVGAVGTYHVTATVKAK